MNQQPATPDLDDVLTAYVGEGDTPSRERLAAWIRRYPRFERPLTEITVGWSVMETLPTSPEVAQIPAAVLVRRGMRVVNAVLYGAGAAAARPASGRAARQVAALRRPDPYARRGGLGGETAGGLTAAARRQGLTLQHLARSTGLGVFVLREMENGAIPTPAVPRAAMRAIADALRLDVQTVARAMAPTRPFDQRFPVSDPSEEMNDRNRRRRQAWAAHLDDDVWRNVDPVSPQTDALAGRPDADAGDRDMAADADDWAMWVPADSDALDVRRALDVYEDVPRFEADVAPVDMPGASPEDAMATRPNIDAAADDGDGDVARDHAAAVDDGEREGSVDRAVTEDDRERDAWAHRARMADRGVFNMLADRAVVEDDDQTDAFVRAVRRDPTMTAEQRAYWLERAAHPDD